MDINEKKNYFNWWNSYEDEYLAFVFKEGNAIHFAFYNDDQRLKSYLLDPESNGASIAYSKANLSDYQKMLDDDVEYKQVTKDSIYVLKNEVLIKYDKQSFKELASFKIENYNNLSERYVYEDLIVYDNNFLIRKTNNELIILDENLK